MANRHLKNVQIHLAIREMQPILKTIWRFLLLINLPDGTAVNLSKLRLNKHMRDYLTTMFRATQWLRYGTNSAAHQLMTE